MLDYFLSWFWGFSSLWILFSLLLATRIKHHFHHGFNQYPAPGFASITDWWRFVVVARKKCHFSYLKLHRDLGDIVRLGPNTLSFADPKAIKVIYGLNNNLSKSGFYPVQMQVSKGEVLQSLFGTTDQDYHARLRRVVSSAFSMSSMVQFEPRVNETAQVFLDQTEELFVKKNRTCDFKLWLQYFAFDVITQITYSRRVGFIDREEDVDGIIAWLDRLFDYSSPVGQMPILDKLLVKNPILILLSKYGWIDNSSGTARFSKARMAERFKEISERRAAGQQEVHDRSDLLTMFLKLQRDDKSEFFNDSRLLTMTTSIALAGSDTAAISLCAVFYNLLRNPECYQRLQREIGGAIASGLIEDRAVFSWNDVQKLPYLDACIKETFRVHPAISMNLERVTPPEGVDICGEFIPGGTIVSCNPWVVQRRPEIFGQDADSYRPERWLIDQASAAYKEMNAAMLHFGAGSRTCLGKHIAMLEMYKLIPSFLRRFELHLTSDEKWDLRCAWFVKPVQFDVRIEKRVNENQGTDFDIVQQ